MMPAGEAMMTDEELMQKIDEVSGDFKGQVDHLYEAVGMIVVGRLFGWELMRLASSRRCWSTATKLFGDPKLLMRARGKYAYKSYALDIIDGAKDYWEIIRGHKPMSMDERRLTK
jgi:hypothetical protein